MKKVTFLTLILAMLYVHALSAQKKPKPTMSFVKGFWGSKYQYGVEELSMSDAGQKFEYESPEAFASFKKARTAEAFAYISSFGGGFLLGYEGASALRGAEINGTRGGIGVGLLIIGFLIEGSATKNFEDAAYHFNNKKTSSLYDKLEINLADANGVGVKFRF
jgi:hypothetical protein